MKYILSFCTPKLNYLGKEPQFYFIDPYANYSEFKDVDDLIDKVFNVEAIQYKVFGEK